MKRNILLLITILSYVGVFAQGPALMSYQAVVRNSDNQLVTNTQVGVQVSILATSANGNTVYSETHTVSTNENGLLHLQIGAGSTTDDFATIDWAAETHFIKTEIDLDGGTNYTITGTNQLLSVPYAMYANSAASVTNEADPDFNAWDKSTGISISESQISDLQSYITEEADPEFNAWDKTTGIEISESQITDLQNYVTEETDPAFGAWDKSTGITITEAQITDLKNYIETENQNLDDVLTKGTDAGNKNITNLATPVNAQDAATKEYVDGVKTMLLDYIASLGVTDPKDGRHYPAVAIGNQIWMAENLKYLPAVNQSTTTSTTDPYYYVYGYEGFSVDAAKLRENYITYGVLYNWPAAMNGEESSDTNPSGVQGICPDGWHLPSDAEWEELIEYLGNTLAQEKLKESGNAHWIEPSNATNETGFTALPGGTLYQGEFINLTRMGYWWSATQESATVAKYRMMHYENYVMLPNPNPTAIDKEIPMSIRCIRD